MKKKSNLVKDQCVYIRDEEIKSHSSFTYHKIQQLYTSQIPFSISPTRTYTHMIECSALRIIIFQLFIFLIPSSLYLFPKKNPNQITDFNTNAIIDREGRTEEQKNDQ